MNIAEFLKSMTGKTVFIDTGVSKFHARVNNFPYPFLNTDGGVISGLMFDADLVDPCRNNIFVCVDRIVSVTESWVNIDGDSDYPVSKSLSVRWTSDPRGKIIEGTCPYCCHYLYHNVGEDMTDKAFCPSCEVLLDHDLRGVK